MPEGGGVNVAPEACEGARRSKSAHTGRVTHENPCRSLRAARSPIKSDKVTHNVPRSRYAVTHVPKVREPLYPLETSYHGKASWQKNPALCVRQSFYKRRICWFIKDWQRFSTCWISAKSKNHESTLIKKEGIT